MVKGGGQGRGWGGRVGLVGVKRVGDGTSKGW